MMPERAIQLAESDALNDQARLQSARSPSDFAKLAIRRLEHRARHLALDDDIAWIGEAILECTDGTTVSDHVARRFHAVLAKATEHLGPEGAMALGVWMAGTPKAAGYLARLLSQVPDSALRSSVNAIAAMAQDVSTRALDDHRSFHIGHFERMSKSQERAVRGMVLSSKWAEGVGDGVTWRLRRGAARKISKKFARQALLRERLFAAEV